MGDLSSRLLCLENNHQKIVSCDLCEMILLTLADLSVILAFFADQVSDNLCLRELGD